MTGTSVAPRNNLIVDTRTFMQAVDHTSDQVNIGQMAFYTGMQLEELAEKLTLIFGEDSPLIIQMTQFADDFKSGKLNGLIEVNLDQAHEMLDADFDLAWVSTCAAWSQGADVANAFAEGTKSNLDKISPDGKVIKDANNKVQKPAWWKKPNFAAHLNPALRLAPPA